MAETLTKPNRRSVAAAATAAAAAAAAVDAAATAAATDVGAVAVLADRLLPERHDKPPRTNPDQ